MDRGGEATEPPENDPEKGKLVYIICLLGLCLNLSVIL